MLYLMKNVQNLKGQPSRPVFFLHVFSVLSKIRAKREPSVDLE